MYHGLIAAQYDEHVARGARDNFKPLTFSQFSALRYKILDCR